MLLATALAFNVVPAAYAAPEVVASIKPVHSLVAGVMDGIASPKIVVEGAASPHTFSLRPSKARELQQAKLIFWIGPQIETFLEKPIANLGQNATVIELGDAHDLTRLQIREGSTFESHEHDDHAAAENPGHDDHREDADHDAHHTEDGINGHFWLDPDNAKIFVTEIEKALSVADPDNGPGYAANAARMNTRLDALSSEIHATLEPVKDVSFVVFHDAYHYFENHFDIHAAGSVTVSPEIAPGAERIRDIKAKLKELEVTCVFSEPQFKPNLISVVTEGTNANAAVLDPLGAQLDDGPDLYFTLMRKLAADMRECMTGDS
jgi:zinc transport system substrate-binding protein